MSEEKEIKPRGKYIVIEGVDGVGKTTLAKLLAEKLHQLYPTRYFAEPSQSGHVNQMLRKFALDRQYAEEMTPIATELVLLANRANSNVVLNQILDQGTHVICDRSIMSGLAYSAASGNVTMGKLWCVMNTLGLVGEIDYVIYLTTKKKKVEAVEGDIYDLASEEFTKKLEENYAQASYFMRKVCPLVSIEVDLDKSPEDNVTKIIYELLLLWGCRG